MTRSERSRTGRLAPARDVVPLLAMIAILGASALVSNALRLPPGASSGRDGTTFAREALPFVDAAMARGLVPGRARIDVDGIAPALNALHPGYVPSALASLTFESRPALGALLVSLLVGAALAPLCWLALRTIGGEPARGAGRACLWLLLLALPAWVVAMQASGVRVLTAEQVLARSVCWMLYGACCLHLIASVLRRPKLEPARCGLVAAGLYAVVFHWWRPASLSPWLPDPRPLAAEHDAIVRALADGGRRGDAPLGELASPLVATPFLAFGLFLCVLFLAPRLEAWLGRRHPLLPLCAALGALAAILLVARGDGITLLTPREALERQAVLFLVGAALLERFCRREPLRGWLDGDPGSSGRGRDGPSRPRLSEETRRHADEGRRIAAIGQHRSESGAGLAETVALIEEHLARRR